MRGTPIATATLVAVLVATTVLPTVGAAPQRCVHVKGSGSTFCSDPGDGEAPCVAGGRKAVDTPSAGDTRDRIEADVSPGAVEVGSGSAEVETQSCDRIAGAVTGDTPGDEDPPLGAPRCLVEVEAAWSVPVGTAGPEVSESWDDVVCVEIRVSLGRPFAASAETSTRAASFEVPGPSPALAADGGGDDGVELVVGERPGGNEVRPASKAPVDGAAPSLGHRVVAAGASMAALLGHASVRLYRRLRRSDVLDNELRSRMLEVVQDRPGVHASELADTLDVAVNTVLYHTEIMAEYDILIVRRTDGEIRYFDPEVHDELEQVLHSSLRKDARREIVELVREEPGIGLAEAARRLGRDPSAVKYHVDKLVGEGLIADEGSGRSRAFVLPPAVKRLLDSDA